MTSSHVHGILHTSALFQAIDSSGIFQGGLRMAGGEQSDQPRCLVQDTQRLADVEHKHARIRELLRVAAADAVLLQDPANLAWLTAGADLTRNTPDGCQTSIFVTEEARVFATNAVDSPQLFERDVFGLGFQLKEREWFQPHRLLVEDLCRGRRVLCDTPLAGTRLAARPLQSLRLSLTTLDVQRLRQLCRVLVHAVEVTAGQLRPGITEAAVAGEIAHRLLRRTVQPVRIQVCADGRNQRYRRWSFGEDSIQNFASVSCTARRWGLHAAVSRTMCFGDAPRELAAAHQKAALVHATGLHFTRPGETVAAVWTRVRRIYEKFGMPSEWLLADQADLLGYRPSEHQFVPASDLLLQPGMLVFWHPSMGAAMPGDTLLLGSQRGEFLTESSVWPEVRVHVRDQEWRCCGILSLQRRDAADESARWETESDQTELEFPRNQPEPARLESIWELDPAIVRMLRP
ncbi:MAG: M24 family metallopeptidase [Planctomycetota bacterium]